MSDKPKQDKDKVPENALTYFKTIIVPIANPNTARQMLQLACSLVAEENGRVIALTVALENDEEDDKAETSERVETLENIVAEFETNDQPVEIVPQIASSITRGILDGTRENGGELLILGVQQHARRQVKLGNVVENIIETAPCNVLVYRMAETSEYNRVVVPLDSTSTIASALTTGILIAKRREILLSPMYIQRDYNYRADREAEIRDLLKALPRNRVQKEMVQGRNPAERILRDINDDDLLIVGFEQREDLQLQLGRDMAETLLNRAPCSVLLSSQILQHRGTIRGQAQMFYQRLTPVLTQVERNELVWQSRRNAVSGIDYLMLITMSAALSSFGLLLNSSAVIIGAMLVAPLMSPLGALAVGIITGQFDITRRSVLTLLQGVLLALIISSLVGFVLPIDTPTTEMTSRGNPSLLDAGVALFSGLVAAFALARKEIPVALAGVAIAAALMPPICTIGLGLALGELRLALGATLLFTTNILFIVAFENLIFFWVGMRPGRRQEHRRVTAIWWGAIATLVAIVVGLILWLGQQASIETRIESYLLDEFQQSGEVELISTTVEEQNNTLNVLFNVVTDFVITPPQVETLEAGLENQFGRDVNLEVVTQAIIRPRSAAEQDITSYLQEQMNVTRIIQIHLEQQRAADDTTPNTLLVEATVRATAPITPPMIAEAEATLSEQLGQPVTLALVVQQVLTAETTAEPTTVSNDTETDANNASD